jgi:hypothetical protein
VFIIREYVRLALLDALPCQLSDLELKLATGDIDPTPLLGLSASPQRLELLKGSTVEQCALIKRTEVLTSFHSCFVWSESAELWELCGPPHLQRLHCLSLESENVNDMMLLAPMKVPALIALQSIWLDPVASSTAACTASISAGNGASSACCASAGIMNSEHCGGLFLRSSVASRTQVDESKVTPGLRLID